MSRAGDRQHGAESNAEGLTASHASVLFLRRKDPPEEGDTVLASPSFPQGKALKDNHQI